MTDRGREGRLVSDAELLDRTEDLVASVRSLMQVSAVTDVGSEQMRRARELIDEASALLGTRVREHAVRRHLDRDAIGRAREGEPWQLFAHNPLGIPLRVQVDGDAACAVIEPSPLLEGPPRLLHGGFSAAMLDAVLGTLVQVQDLRAVTARLHVRFVRPVPLDLPLEVRGRISSVDGRKVHAEGWIERAGERVVEASALLVSVAGEPD